MPLAMRKKKRIYPGPGLALVQVLLLYILCSGMALLPMRGAIARQTGSEMGLFTPQRLTESGTRAAGPEDGWYFFQITRPAKDGFWFRINSSQGPSTGLSRQMRVSLTAKLANELAELDWVAEMGARTSHFVIQRSVDGHRFADKGIVFAQERNEARMKYSYSDDLEEVNAGLVYYRIKMVYDDGRHRYSNVVLLKMNSSFLAGIQACMSPGQNQEKQKTTNPGLLTRTN
jgi:hypothetical protein